MMHAHALDLKYLARQIFTFDVRPEPFEYLPPDWELIWVIEGNAMVRHGERLDRIGPYSLFVNRPGEPARFIPVSDAPVVVGVVILYSHPYGDLPPFRQSERDDVTIALLEHALWLESDRPEGWEAAVEWSLTHALWVYATGSSGHLPSAVEFAEPIMRLVGRLRSDWEFGPLRAPTLDQLAGSAGVSKVHLCRLFDAEFGHGPVETLRLIRIHDAAGLIRSGLGRREVARRTGFATERHFSHVFRAVVGMTPTEFRDDREARFVLPRPVHRFRSHLFRPRRLT